MVAHSGDTYPGATPEIPGLSGLADLAGRLRFTASFAAPDRFKGLATSYDHETGRAIFSANSSLFRRQSLAIAMDEEGPIIETVERGQGPEYDGTSTAIEVTVRFPLYAGAKGSKKVVTGFPSADGSLLNPKLDGEEDFDLDEQTCSNLTETLNTIRDKEQRAAANEGRGFLARALAWLIRPL